MTSHKNAADVVWVEVKEMFCGGVGEFCNRTENTIEPERGRLTEENLYLSDEGVANRGALPLAAQNTLHVSCRVGKYQHAQTWDLIVQRSSLGAFPHNLCWLQALQQTESVLWRHWRGPQRERRQGLPTSLPGPSSQAGWRRCQEWRCRMEVVVVTAGDSCHTWGGAAHPRKVEDCQV